MPGEGIHLHAVVAHPPLDSAVVADRFDRLGGAQHQQAYPVHLRLADGGRHHAPGQFENPVPQPLEAELGADPLPEVGYTQDDGAAPLCVGETGHFLSQVGGGRLVLALARLDGPGPATPSGFLLDVHEALLYVARSLSSG